MDIKKILDKYFQDKTGDNKVAIEKWLIKVKELISIEGKSEEEALLDKINLRKIYAFGQETALGKNTYANTTTLLAILFDYYGISKENLPKKEELLDARTFFKDLDDILSYIDRIGTDVVENYDKNYDFVRSKSIIILNWFGFSPKEIITLSSDDLKEENGLFYIGTKDHTVSLEEKYYVILKRQSTALFYKGIQVGTTFSYPSRDKTLIVAREGKSLTIDGLNRTQRDINKALEKYSKTIVFKYIKKFKIFNDIFKDSSGLPTVEKMMNYAQCHYRTAQDYVIDYEFWVSLYHT